MIFSTPILFQNLTNYHFVIMVWWKPIFGVNDKTGVYNFEYSAKGILRQYLAAQIKCSLIICMKCSRIFSMQL